MPPQYKFVEVAPVTDETLEECVNEWTGNGWGLEGIRFVTTEHSKRPAMAFVSFIREAQQSETDREAPRKPRPLVAVGPGTSISGDDDDQPAVLTAAAGTDVD